MILVYYHIKHDHDDTCIPAFVMLIVCFSIASWLVTLIQIQLSAFKNLFNKVKKTNKQKVYLVYNVRFIKLINATYTIINKH